MKKTAARTYKTRRTRIRISSSEKMTFWRAPQSKKNDVVLECPFCGHEVFWVDVENTPDVELYEEIQSDETDDQRD